MHITTESGDTMTRINDDFMEAYKRLDVLCKDIFQSDRGITTYIDTMQNIKSGAYYVPGWNTTLRTLKTLRHIRNNYTHEVNTSYSDICSQEDIVWINDFYDSILATRDPLAVYAKATKNAPAIPHIKTFQHIPKEDELLHSDTSQNKNFSGLDLPLILFIIAMVIVVSFLLLH